MSSDSSAIAREAPAAIGAGWASSAGIALRSVFIVLGFAVLVQALVVVQARPQDLVTGFHGMADFGTTTLAAISAWLRITEDLRLMKLLAKQRQERFRSRRKRSSV